MNAFASTVHWLRSTRLFGFFGRYIARLLRKARIGVSYYNQPERSKIVELIGKVKDETELLLSTNEAFLVYSCAQETMKIDGDIAEVGVYNGGSARLICEAKGKRPLHLFDTFKGIPEVGRLDKFKKGEYSGSKEWVEKYLKDYPGIAIFEGIFPDTGKAVEDRRFSMAHLDVDTYKGTAECLKFFYPRMNVGGMILVHDYINAEGVKKAVDEFFVNKPEPVIKTGDSYALIVKVKP